MRVGILLTFKRWLAPLNGKAFPNFNLKNGVFEILDEVCPQIRNPRAVQHSLVLSAGSSCRGGGLRAA